MATAANSVDINRPVEAVCRFLADGLNNPKWRSAVAEINLVSGTGSSVGAVYKQAVKGPFGRKVDGDYRLVEATPNSRIKFEVVTGPARPICLFEIEPTSGGARVKFLLSYEPRGLMWLMNGMIQSRMIAEVQNLSVLKSVMEAK